MLDPEVHRTLAIEANNSASDLVRLPVGELDTHAIEAMTRQAYAAAHHWSIAPGATIANEARAEWLISRVWAVRGNGALSLHHARRCLDACERGGLEDFDLAYAHEALARAHACLGEVAEARRHQETATRVPLADDEDESWFREDFSAEPWFGVNPERG